MLISKIESPALGSWLEKIIYLWHSSIGTLLLTSLCGTSEEVDTQVCVVYKHFGRSETLKREKLL